MCTPDILVFMSDQHTADLCGFRGDAPVRTPHLDSIAQAGISFDNAYTSCPLCVPARASFMTSCLPSRLQVFNNDDAYSSGEVTFAHSIASVGYETVLCGRMHFMGQDQRHGFTKRVANDITSSLTGHAAIDREDLGEFKRVFAQKYCTEIVGCGNSPVLNYDNYVVNALDAYLKTPPEKPQLIVCGTYGPHFPYMAAPEKVRYYESLLQGMPYEPASAYPESAFSEKRQVISPERLIKLRAVYCAMVETMDEHVGHVKQAFERYLEKNHREGVFLYLSDHGDQIGRKQYFGKQTFYEYSARIPLLMCGAGIPVGKRIGTPVSLMDVGQTLCGLTGAPLLPDADGMDLRSLFDEQEARSRRVLSEFYDCGKDGHALSGYMVRDDRYKLITYAGYEEEDILLDMLLDPREHTNLAEHHPDILARLKAAVPGDAYRQEKTRAYQRHVRMQKILNTWGKQNPWANIDVWYADSN